MKVPAFVLFIISLCFAFYGCNFKNNEKPALNTPSVQQTDRGHDDGHRDASGSKKQANPKDRSTSRRLLLPKIADNSSVVYLGKSVDPITKKTVEGIAFICYEKGFGKTNKTEKQVHKESSKCYAFLVEGIKWKSTENYIFDPTNNRGLNHATLRSLLANSTKEWNKQAEADIFGVEVDGEVDNVDALVPNGKNEVYFAAISIDKVIAMTMVWRISEGLIEQRRITEWDMVFNQKDYDWSTEAKGVSGKMDFHNIAMHEVGHAAGMGHPDDDCVDETMYGHANWAETKKRDLNAGDIAGIRDLYK